MFLRTLAAWLGGALALLAAAPGATGSGMPNTIVPWHAIGGVSIGMEETAVEYRNGVGLDAGTPCATCGHIHLYRVEHESNGLYTTLDVAYLAGRVVFVQTDSPRFRTPDGLAVGSTIPLGRCRVTSGSCVYTWQGLTYARGAFPGIGTWTRRIGWGGHNIRVIISVRRGRVLEIAMDTRPR